MTTTSLAQTAVQAARTIAAQQGLGAVAPRVVGDGSNHIIWLDPAVPLVARVMTGTVVLHPDPREWLAREIDVCRFLASRGVPVVAPAATVDPGPHHVDGLWLSLWEHVDVVARKPSGAAVGASLRELHDALVDYRGPLAPRSAILGEMDALLATLRDHPEHDAWRAERDRLAPLLTDLDVPRLPIHGDASLRNLLSTAGGLRWNDFEDVCRGSAAWDAIGLLGDVRATRGDAYADAVAAAYGHRFDTELVALVGAVEALNGALWRAYCRTAAASPEHLRPAS